MTDLIPDYLRDLTIPSMILRITLSIIIGGILGFERGRVSRPAGFRTYIIVCLGATLIMMTNHYVYDYFGVSDPVRLGAQVVSGIGFLGAGTIIQTNRNQVQGITTAAGLWASAGLGLAIGIGFYEGAIIGGLAILTVLTILQVVNNLIKRNTKEYEVYIEFEERIPFSTVLNALRDRSYELLDIHMSKDILRTQQEIILVLRSEEKKTHEELIREIASIEGVTFVQEF